MGAGSVTKAVALPHSCFETRFALLSMRIRFLLMLRSGAEHRVSKHESDRATNTRRV
jgi:hypothetical protein